MWNTLLGKVLTNSGASDTGIIIPVFSVNSDVCASVPYVKNTLKIFLLAIQVVLLFTRLFKRLLPLLLLACTCTYTNKAIKTFCIKIIAMPIQYTYYYFFNYIVIPQIINVLFHNFCYP